MNEKNEKKPDLDIEKMADFGNQYRDVFCEPCMEKLTKKSSKFRSKLAAGKQPSVIDMILMQRIKICDPCKTRLIADVRQKQRGGFRKTGGKHHDRK